MMRKHLFFVGILFVLSMAFVACGDDEPSSVNGSWTAKYEDGSATFTFSKDNSVTFREVYHDESDVYTGTYEVEDNKITMVFPDMTSFYQGANRKGVPLKYEYKIEKKKLYLKPLNDPAYDFDMFDDVDDGEWLEFTKK